MNNTYLFLDDIRMPIQAFEYTKLLIYKTENWVIVRNYDEFVEHIEKHGIPKFIGYDHDLADEHYFAQTKDFLSGKLKEKTGYDCANYLVNKCIDLNCDVPDFYVHSMNQQGKIRIESLLLNYRNHFLKNAQ